MGTAGQGAAPADPGRTLAAVLLDMDGTLVDSEKVWDLTLNELAAHLGGRLDPRTRAAMIGTNLLETVRMLHDDVGSTADIQSSGRFLLARTREYFARGLPLRPGADDLLTAVRAAGLPTALVTTTHRDLVEVALRSIGPDRFDAVVCGDEVTHAKPHPESYLRAAGLLGHPPAGCLAVEDSLTGASAAAAAGCAVLVVPSEVAIAPRPEWVVWPTLRGVSVADLRRVHAERHDRRPPTPA